jgi:CBS domain-containing membrane protein
MSAKTRPAPTHSAGHRSDTYHVMPGPDSSLRGGMAFQTESGPPDALAGAPCVARVRAYLRKMGGGLDSALPLPQPIDAAVSTVGAFLGILAVAGVDAAIRGDAASDDESALPLLVYSLGASAVLLFGVPESKLSQPRNLLGGHIVSAAVGCTVRAALGARALWLTAAAGMSAALLAMELTSTVHPPGGATALIGASARALGPWYGFRLVASAAAGAAIMLVVALLVNNCHPRTRGYPTFYWGGPVVPAWCGRAAAWWGRRGAATAAGKEGGGAADTAAVTAAAPEVTVVGV